jgi:hypothetical protein
LSDVPVVFMPVCPWAQACEAARDFNRFWPCELQLLVNDCHNHTKALVHQLTGKTVNLEKFLPLRRSKIWI